MTELTRNVSPTETIPLECIKYLILFCSTTSNKRLSTLKILIHSNPVSLTKTRLKMSAVAFCLFDPNISFIACL